MLHTKIKQSKGKDDKLPKKFTDLESFYDKLYNSQEAPNMLLGRSLEKKILLFNSCRTKSYIKSKNRPKTHYTWVPNGSIIKPKVIWVLKLKI